VTVLAPESAGEPRHTAAGSLELHRVIPRGRLPMTLTDPRAVRRSARALGGSFDVALAHQCTNACGILASGVQAPLALVLHASALRELRFDRSRAGLGGKARMTALEPVLARLERRAAANAVRVLALSEFTRSLVASDRPAVLGRVLRVSGGVDVEAFRPPEDREGVRARLGVDGGRPLLLTVRRLAPRMGLETLLVATSRLAQPRPQLAIAGTGRLAPTLERLARDLGIADDVRFLGRLPDSDLAAWYGAADLFVLPTVAYEGFGMVTAEALACGTPVVGTPVGATPELLQPLEPRLVAADEGADALAAAISETLAGFDGELRARCRAYAVEGLSWDVVMQGWEAALEETVAAASPQRLDRAAAELPAERGAA
jgi:glycosyltransferase involved in cell wall biosynthesis